MTASTGAHDENADGQDTTSEAGAPAPESTQPDGGPGSHSEDGSGGAENDTASGGVPEESEDS
ncbi:MAG TPA: hypothetical protein VFM86_07320 [Pedococcus sp.]|nr:hypothetical protein [Pedococcus sp.]